MKRFRFTLTALKTLRERREREATEAYAQAQRNEARALAELDRLKESLAAVWTERQAIMDQGVAAQEVMRILAFCQTLQRQCQTQENHVALARQQLRQKWDHLVRARREREVVDKFFERQRKRHLAECQVEEQKLLDELAGRPQPGGLTDPLSADSRDRS